MLKSMLFFLLLAVFTVSNTAQVPDNVEKAQRNRIAKDKITVEKSYIQSTEQSEGNMLALESRSSSQLQELGTRYGFVRSNSQLDELGTRYGFVRSNSMRLYLKALDGSIPQIGLFFTLAQIVPL